MWIKHDFPSACQEDITSEVKVAIAAKTTFVALDQMGYTYMDVSGNQGKNRDFRAKNQEPITKTQ